MDRRKLILCLVINLLLAVARVAHAEPSQFEIKNPYVFGLERLVQGSPLSNRRQGRGRGADSSLSGLGNFSYLGGIR